MNKVAIYTAIFGNRSKLQEPSFLPAGCDFICYTDSDIQSKVWKVVKTKPIHEDPARSAKIFKILPHEYLQDYEVSVWVDGNMLVRGDVNELIDQYLQDANMAVFSHRENISRSSWEKVRQIFKKYIPGYTYLSRRTYMSRKSVGMTGDAASSVSDPCDSVYEESNRLLALALSGKTKDDPLVIKRQIEHYKNEQFPDDGGLLVGMILLRRHNKEDVIKTMETWWREIESWSRRDQLSFNYVAWKNNFKFVYMSGDSRNNIYFLWSPHK